MAKIALACTILPDSPPARLIEWSRAAEDAGFSGIFMTEANNDSLACSLALGLNTKRISSAPRSRTSTCAIRICSPTKLRGPGIHRRAIYPWPRHGASRGQFGARDRDGRPADQNARDGEDASHRARRWQDRPARQHQAAALPGGRLAPDGEAGRKSATASSSISFRPARVKEALGELAEGARSRAATSNRSSRRCSQLRSSQMIWKPHAVPRASCCHATAR